MIHGRMTHSTKGRYTSLTAQHDWEKMAKSNACDARVIHVIQPLCVLVKYLNQCHYIKEIIRGQSKGSNGNMRVKYLNQCHYIKEITRGQSSVTLLFCVLPLMDQ